MARTYRQEKLEGIIRSRKPKDTQYNGKNKNYLFMLFLSLCSCHCIVCPSVYGFWLYLQAFLVCMFLPFYCVSFGVRLLIIPWSCSCLYVLAIVLCVLRFTASDYPFNLFLSLCSSHCIVCPSVYASDYPFKLFLSLCSSHCIVWPSIYGFWLFLQTFLCYYVLGIVLCVLRFTLLIIPSIFSLSLCSCHCIVCPSVYASDYPFNLFLSLCSCHCIVSFGLRILITPSSFSLSVCYCHCIVCPSVYGFWLPLQSFLVFLFLPLYCVSFGFRLVFTPSHFFCFYVLS
jgi:hypothetical protein